MPANAIEMEIATTTVCSQLFANSCKCVAILCPVPKVSLAAGEITLQLVMCLLPESSEKQNCAENGIQIGTSHNYRHCSVYDYALCKTTCS